MSKDIDYTKSNQMKVHWHETDTFLEFVDDSDRGGFEGDNNGDNNNGFVYGIVGWYGDRTVDEAIDYEKHFEEADGFYFEWWKTEEERDKWFLNNLPYSKSDWDIERGESQ